MAEGTATERPSGQEAADEALEGQNPDTIRDAFMQARTACMACHVAERVPFMNDQPLFRDLLFATDTPARP